MVNGEAAGWYCHPRQNPTRQDSSQRPGDQAKADLMTAYFSSKMATEESERQPSHLTPLCNLPLDDIVVIEDVVARYLSNVNTRKAPGPDRVSSFLLKHCTWELSLPLTHIFQQCLKSCTWPTAWKEDCIMHVHKKKEQIRSIQLQLNIGAGHC